MLPMMRRMSDYLREHTYAPKFFLFIAAAVLTGLCCVWFMRGFEIVLRHRLDFNSIGAWAWIATPLGFLAAVEIIRRLAPYAAGTGIPQAIFVAAHGDPANEGKIAPLFSVRTIAVKVLTLYLAIWVGASTGREGPTVHVSICVFIGTLIVLGRLLDIRFDRRSAAIAGGAAGLAAAFNTPLAGVTFAIEELTNEYFSSIKDFVLLAIIIAGLTAKHMIGEYAYFGQLLAPPVVSLRAVVLIGIVGGLAGAAFSTLLLKGTKVVKGLGSSKARYGMPVLLGGCVVAIATLSGTRVLGPGNLVAQELLNGQFGAWNLGFPLAKMAATLCTYWSGIAGGIFAPSLSIGASLGADIGQLFHDPVSTCALLGMAAFLSATIQAPITSFMIIFEMTGHHQMVLPLMLSALMGFLVARMAGAKQFYKTLSLQYAPLIETPLSPPAS